ncbi:4-hydroxyacetophenone monooxygenase [Geodermatophilus tzadiensis]|uniref:4-hydroxyacetophenone monooxygenase n=1 Tax=Geodermatophilus tzadiensis TaxID=1137988 RepID=A0A2T0U078_9ACTN|nr:NAD(P)/FAD-dependent oxidoreductase [Geodermatophilus tzadiensis]PRY51313.1 4-hydroxyacetophenone monooxygenase [Geodermatophilus tzadiensis]
MTDGIAPHPVDPGRLRAAVAHGNVPTLLAVVHQLTGDPRWLTERYRPTRSRGMDDNRTGGLPEEVQEEIRRGVVDAVLAWSAGRPAAIDRPAGDRLSGLIDVVMGEPVPPEFAPMLSEVMGFTAAPARVPVSGDAGRFSVVVVGAGVAGMLASARLSEAGVGHVVLEKNSEVGGGWYENTYPGAGVDTPSYLYSYSFFPRNWSTHFGKRDEVQAYLEDFADAFGLRSNVRFGTEVTAARWDGDTQRWQVTAVGPDGVPYTLTANAVISAVGVLNRPRIPPLPGLDSFSGPLFHSARWPTGLDLTGKRVALVGAGASAMQIGPAIAGRVASLTVFQRSPQWIAPNDVYFSPVGEDVHWLMEHVPYYAAWYRARLSWIFNDKVHPTLQVDPDWGEERASINAANHGHRRFYTRYLTEQLAGRPDLVDKSLPDYPPFGKRMLLDNGWYAMLRRDDVDLVTEAVTEVTETGLVDSAGRHREFDVVIMATGFHTDRYLHPMEITGRSGRTTREVWGEHDATAYLGITVPDFPNLFVLTGPNTALGHGGSFITILECQVRYVMDVLSTMVEQDLGAVEVRQEVHDAYNRAVDEAHGRMVWTHPGMTNWYRNADGRVVAVLPWRIVEYWRMTHEADLFDYRTEPAVAAAAGSGRTGTVLTTASGDNVQAP